MQGGFTCRRSTASWLNTISAIPKGGLEQLEHQIFLIGSERLVQGLVEVLQTW
jgi:hypothetical protein